MNKRNIIEKLVREELTNVINEGGFNMSDEELKQLAMEKLQVAHTALNNLMMPLLVNSQKSEFAKNLFNIVKQADDTILFARKDF